MPIILALLTIPVCLLLKLQASLTVQYHKAENLYVGKSTKLPSHIREQTLWAKQGLGLHPHPPMMSLGVLLGQQASRVPCHQV